MTTGYEKVPHAIFAHGTKKSRSYPCKADAEIAIGIFRLGSMYHASAFEVREVEPEAVTATPEMITINRSDLEMMIEKGKNPDWKGGQIDTDYNVLGMSVHCLIKHIEGLLE